LVSCSDKNRLLFLALVTQGPHVSRDRLEIFVRKLHTAHRRQGTWVVRQEPDRIERLALLDTSALSDTREQTERRLKLIAMAQAANSNPSATLYGRCSCIRRGTTMWR
jgi:hypothetical protein